MFKAELCSLCGDCLVNCRFIKYTRHEAIVERQTLMEGKRAPIVDNCVSCHACNATCPQGANPFDLISRLQGEFGVMEDVLKRVDLATAKTDKARPALLAGPRFDPVQTVLATCSYGEKHPRIFESLLYHGLRKLTGPAYSCVPREFFGDESGQKARVQGFVDSLAMHQAEEVICYHDSCYYMLTYRAPEYAITVPFRPVHLYEYLLRTLRMHRDRIRPLNMKIAYQEPCTSRGNASQNPPLDELLQIIGCLRVARRYDRDNSLCCGEIVELRGLTEKADEITKKQIDDSLEHGAQGLACLCGGCMNRFREQAAARGLQLYHVTELCHMAIGENPALLYPASASG